MDEFGEIGLQLALLVDPPLLHTVPALLLSDAQRAGDVVAKVQPLLFCQIISWRRKQRGFLMQCSTVCRLAFFISEKEAGVF